MVSGKTADLSGFGTDVSTWVTVDYRVSAGQMQLLVNGVIAYKGPAPPVGLKILGVAFGFENGGAVKGVTLQGKREDGF